MDWYLVSNVGMGNPAALDHNGFISKVTPRGVVRDLVPNPFAPKPLFVNDVVVAGDGAVYLTDNRKCAIFWSRSRVSTQNQALRSGLFLHRQVRLSLARSRFTRRPTQGESATTALS